MKSRFLLIITFLISTSLSQGAELAADSGKVPFKRLFYRMDRHVLNSFTYHYGANYLLAGGLTYGIVKTGMDWQWNRYSYHHSWITYSGFPSVIVGGLVPMFVPASFYIVGRIKRNVSMQTTSLAVGQAAIISLVITSTIKAFTGRRPPEIMEGNTAGASDYSGDFRFGFLRRGAFDGWPSSHTAVAFSLAAVMAEMYPDRLGLKIGAFTYASLIGLGVSTNIHWFSDAVAGALIGYAIGKSVGMGFKQLNAGSSKHAAFHYYLTPAGVGLCYNF